MNNSDIKYDLSFAFSLFMDMQAGNLNYIYRGFFTQNITDNILALTENSMTESGEINKIKKRVYTILVEGLQNITRHQDETDTDSSEKSGIFVIQKKDSKYFITTGNVIDDSKIDNLRKLLEKINSLESSELKTYYKEVLEMGGFSNKGGAGLGLIEMARKSNNKLVYDFVKLYNDISYFYLHSGISFRDDTFSQIEDELKKSLKNIIHLHSVLNKENIQLIFNGFFSQESLVSLLSIIEGQMSSSYAIRKQLFSIVVELLQNIVRHGETPGIQSEKGRPGMFFISKNKESHLLTTGNYLKTTKVKELTDKINFINNLSINEVENYYNEMLLNFKNDENFKSGLGIVDLRMKSKNQLVFDFNKVDDTYSFFTLQATV